MKEYGLTEARQNFTAILDEARKDGVVCIRKKDSEVFYLHHAEQGVSPLDVPGVDLGLSAEEIVAVVRECRRRDG